MTAKDFVKEYLPTARSERQTSGRVKGMKRVYWLIRETGKSDYFAEGTSESNAWVNAKSKIIELGIEKPNKP